MAYRVAVAVNMLLMCSGIFLILGIIKRLFPEIERKMQVFIGGIAVFYPVWIFNMQMTMTEALLMFLFVLITYLFVCFMQKPNIVTAFFLTASLAYSYCVHMRTGRSINCLRHYTGSLGSFRAPKDKNSVSFYRSHTVVCNTGRGIEAKYNCAGFFKCRQSGFGRK